MRHRFRSKVTARAVNGRAATILFRCKRCGVSVSVPLPYRRADYSPYDECESRGIPTDCNESVARQVMES